jgi:hydrogenase/urease accessory protein HupE
MKKLLSVLALLVCSWASIAHTINYQVYKPTYENVWIEFIVQGFKHIIPLGLDHILFITCIFFLNNNLKTILQQSLLFTIAHSITLGLAANGMFIVTAAIVEPIIALSIAILALENVFANKVKPYRLLLIFVFGLVHGMGFASALSDLQLPSNDFTKALLSFNIGVEAGQLAVILLLYLTTHIYFINKVWYRSRILVPINVGICALALYWTFERMSF